MGKNIFIFVVCGGEEHIHTLHFSLKRLQRFSKNEIWVITDKLRNEIPIEHTSVIDIQTPEEFNHHQASIYLKTGIHRFLPQGNLYCYLDTDVIALKSECDLIFEQYKSPISFGADHCKMPFFSPFAMNCDCAATFKAARDRFEEELTKTDPLRQSKDLEIQQYRSELQKRYLSLRNNKLKALLTAVRYFISYPEFKLSEDILFDKGDRKWKTGSGKAFMHDFKIRKVARSLGFRWNYFNQEPELKDGRSIWKDQCIHLQQGIAHKFNVEVTAKNWQHWNGGVFLFDDDSHPFLESWHQSSVEIFKDNEWKTRDQGTLIKTVWQFKLENHPVLDKKWNLIADYYNPFLKWENDFQIRFSENELIDANFVHVYHHFGDESWDFWNQTVK